MAGQREVTITVTLDSSVAQALAQFVKRCGWAEYRACAVSDDEAYEIRDGVSALQDALRLHGYAPR